MQLQKNNINKILAAGILATFVSLGADAVTVFEKDRTKVDLKGDLQIQVRQKVGIDEDAYMDFDDLTAAFGAKHKSDNGVTSYGLLKMDWKKQASGDAKAGVDEGFVGLDFGKMAVEIGRLDWGSDSFYADQAVEIGNDLIATPKAGGYESIKAMADLGMAKLIVSGDLEVDENSSVAEAYLVTNPKELLGLELGFLYQSYTPATVPADEEAGTAAVEPDAIDTVGVRAMYKLNKVKLGADFTTNDDKDVANVSVGSPIAGTATSVAAGMAMEMPDAGDDVNTWYANMKHKVNKITTVFAEVGGDDKDDTDLGYLAGMKVKF
ncbi:MAG: porin [Verrucomicrobiota bacterium]